MDIVNGLESLMKAALKSTDVNVIKELANYLSVALGVVGETTIPVGLAEGKYGLSVYEIRTEDYVLSAQREKGFEEPTTDDGVVIIFSSEYETFICHPYPKEIVILLDIYFKYRLFTSKLSVGPFVQWMDENLREDSQ